MTVVIFECVSFSNIIKLNYHTKKIENNKEVTAADNDDKARDEKTSYMQKHKYDKIKGKAMFASTQEIINTKINYWFWCCRQPSVKERDKR